MEIKNNDEKRIDVVFFYSFNYGTILDFFRYKLLIYI